MFGPTKDNILGGKWLTSIVVSNYIVDGWGNLKQRGQRETTTRNKQGIPAAGGSLGLFNCLRRSRVCLSQRRVKKKVRALARWERGTSE
jgi:hypothetical protein